MDATTWAVTGTGITILISVGTAFRSLRTQMRLFREHVDKRIDGQGERMDGLRDRIATPSPGTARRPRCRGCG